MKKNTLFAIVAMLMMSVSALAQSNSYNMVIEMANGTKISIGPNDVKNIYFNDGELVVSGENLEKLVQTTNENMKQTTKEMSDLNARIATIETMIDKLSNQSDVVSSDEIKKIQAQIAELQRFLEVVISESAKKVDVAEMMQKMDESNKYLSDMINANAKDIKVLEKEIYELQARMDALENKQ